jgi:hypothetical protein
MAQSSETSSSGAFNIYNLITATMLVLTCVMVILVAGALIFNPGPAVAQVVPTATLFTIPTETPTLPGPTVNPTWTSSPTATITNTPTGTFTPVPSRTPTPTDTPTRTPTLTPTNTLTPTFTPTRTNTPEPTSTFTRAPFDFVLKNGTITYVSYDKVIKNINCKWGGMGGQVLGLNNQGVDGLRIHVTGGGIDETVVSGGAPVYGKGGWERSVNNAPSSGLFNVQLEKADGTDLSAVIAVQLIDTCEKNLALVNFQQIQ